MSSIRYPPSTCSERGERLRTALSLAESIDEARRIEQRRRAKEKRRIMEKERRKAIRNARQRQRDAKRKVSFKVPIGFFKNFRVLPLDVLCSHIELRPYRLLVGHYMDIERRDEHENRLTVYIWMSEIGKHWRQLTHYLSHCL